MNKLEQIAEALARTSLNQEEQAEILEAALAILGQREAEKVMKELGFIS